MPSLRLSIASLIALLAPLAVAGQVGEPQRPSANVVVWEKPVVPGLTYRMEIDYGLPRVIHALRWSTHYKGVTAKSSLAQAGVYAAEEYKGRLELSKTAGAAGAIAGVNADFFPWTGDPLGLMVRDGELVSAPHPKRPAFGWGPKGTTTGFVSMEAQIEAEGIEPMHFTGLNQECGDNGLVLNTPAVGLALATKPAIHALLSVDSKLTPDCALTGEVKYFIADSASVKVEPGQMLVTALGSTVKSLLKIPRGAKVTIRVKLKGMDWAAIDNAVSGGQYLLHDGMPNKDWTAGNFKSSFAHKRHPRTSVGRAPNGDVWLVAVDGRQSMSVGATLPEMSAIMSRLGCTDAVNLDGGGSTTLYLRGMVMNRPSDGKERRIADSLLLFAPAPMAADPPPTAVVGTARFRMGTETKYWVIGPDGERLSNGSVLWSAKGSAWIDQSGVLHPIKPGTAVVTAWSLGSSHTVTVLVESAAVHDEAAAQPEEPPTAKPHG